MTKIEESRMRREGIPLSAGEARAILEFINTCDDEHFSIEASIVVKLEKIGGVS